jgi:hypothetical protein
MTKESKPHQILLTINCGDTECGDCEFHLEHETQYLDPKKSLVYSCEIYESEDWEGIKRLSQCLEDEAKAKELDAKIEGAKKALREFIKIGGTHVIAASAIILKHLEEP